MSAPNVLHLFGDATPVPQGDFDEVWKLWPNKANKAVARSKYLSILKGGFTTRTLDKASGQFVELELGASHEQIITGIKAYVASQIDKNTYRLKDEGRFIPHLSTWLGGGRWEDLA